MNATPSLPTPPALWALVIEELVDQHSAALVERAHKLMEIFSKSANKLDRKQLSNLEAVAVETNSVAIVEDFIRYQIGRDDGRNKWRAGDPPLGEAVLKELMRLKAEANNLITAAKQQRVHPPMDEAQQAALIWAVLTRRYVSYLAHSYQYWKSKSGSGGQS